MSLKYLSKLSTAGLGTIRINFINTVRYLALEEGGDDRGSLAR